MEKVMRIAIVGGGATGILAAAHLARRLDPANDEAVVIEPGEALGRGLAYATDDPRHLLNVRVANMSAFADEPHHLTAWLSARRGAGAASPFSFISRGLYGDYLADLAEQTLSNGLVRRVRARCSDIEEKADGVRLTLSTGEALAADVAILATGHDAKPTVGGIPAEQPWSAGALDGLPPDAPILIIGSGLTMVDLALSLERRGQHGPIVVLSRRGLLSTTHRPAPPRSLDASEIPFGSELSASLAWLRRLAARFAADGADWRSAVDALRPHTQRLWGAMSLEQRRRFLRHARSYWDVHRHRMAPQIEAALGALGASGQLTIVAGRVVAARRVDEGVEVEILRRGASAAETRRFARIIDCTGLCEQPLQSANPLLRALLARGAARPDALGIGFDVAPDLSLVGADGTVSRRVKAIGPLARAAFWECIAIPDIRMQCAALADALTKARAPAAAYGLAATAGR
jgi:uncharacterized NAD(P)/FAD-binding protein YdhS